MTIAYINVVVPTNNVYCIHVNIANLPQVYNVIMILAQISIAVKF